jgi:hypothetical protein
MVTLSVAPPPLGDGSPAVPGAGDLHGVHRTRGAAALQPVLRLQILPLLPDPGPGGGAGLVQAGQGRHHRLVRLLPPPQGGSTPADQGESIEMSSSSSGRFHSSRSR